MSEITSANALQMDYMKLLTTQLQNQNPLDPMDNKDMTAQLTQFSQLSQMETMNSRFADILKTVERNHAASLLDKKVSFIGEVSPGTSDLLTGTVTGVLNKGEDQIFLEVGGYSVNLDDVISVQSE